MAIKDFPNLQTKLGVVTTPWGGETAQEAVHPGVDIANKKGTRIPAFAGGRVLETITGRKPGENNYGNSVIIEDAKGQLHKYSHLDNVGVAPGQKVKTGEQIATMGDSGATYSPSGGDPSNLDYRIVNAYGEYVNPTSYLKKV